MHANRDSGGEMKLRTILLHACLLLALVMVVMAVAAAPAAAAPPPTLDGETLTGTTTNATGCSGNTGATYTGEATGPYPGTFTLTFDNSQVEPVVRFTITSAVGTVSGTQRLDPSVQPTISISCTFGRDLVGWTFGYGMFYTAAIGGTYADTGTASLRATAGRDHTGTLTLTFDSTQPATTPLDATKPVITPRVSGTPGSNNWYTSRVSVAFTCADEQGGSGLATPATGYGDTTLTADGANQSATSTGTCRDNAGNVADAATASGINIDTTTPTVAYTGNAGTYTADQAVSITCTPADATASLASHTCANISGPAYTFKLGTNGYAATATDRAGNVGTGSTSFTVTVSAASLGRVIDTLVTDPKVAASLKDLAKQIASAPNAGAKANKLSAYISLVNAQTGKSITPTNAAVLIKLAKAL